MGRAGRRWRGWDGLLRDERTMEKLPTPKREEEKSRERCLRFIIVAGGRKGRNLRSKKKAGVGCEMGDRTKASELV